MSDHRPVMAFFHLTPALENQVHPLTPLEPGAPSNQVHPLTRCTLSRHWNQRCTCVALWSLAVRACARARLPRRAKSLLSRAHVLCVCVCLCVLCGCLRVFRLSPSVSGAFVSICVSVCVSSSNEAEAPLRRESAAEGGNAFHSGHASLAMLSTQVTPR